MPTAADRRTFVGPALLSVGFRPFFLAAATWPAVIVPLWVLAFLGRPPFAGVLTRDWHVHEMLFGYLAGVMAGFLLTAVPNWTGRLPVMGWGLAALVGLWLAGRIAMLVAPLAGWAIAVDCAFLVVFAGVIWREVLAGRNTRNVPVCLLVTLLALANVGVHLRPLAPGLADSAERLALAVAAMMIALIGGRVTPSFTRNWLMQRGDQTAPAAASRFDQVVLFGTGIGMAGWVVAPTNTIAGAALMVAGAANLLRLSRWRGARTLAEPLVWILHAGYGWLGLALAILGASAIWRPVPASAGIHALTVGAIGVMTLAMMTRAILGHTGRPRTARGGTLAIYLCANAAVLLRLAATVAFQQEALLLSLAAAAWSLAFGGFVLLYGPMLVLPRVDQTPARNRRASRASWSQ